MCVCVCVCVCCTRGEGNAFELVELCAAFAASVLKHSHSALARLEHLVQQQDSSRSQEGREGEQTCRQRRTLTQSLNCPNW
eukprot:COSAG05_NODE_478_length_9434_cov_5.178897_7_plen_81_part_00